MYTNVYSGEGRLLRGYKSNTDYREAAEKFNTQSNALRFQWTKADSYR